MGQFDEKTGLAVVSKDLTLASLPPDRRYSPAYDISMRQDVQADRIEYWPTLSIKDSHRRQVIYDAAEKALLIANEQGLSDVGFYTFGYEVARIPSWEVAEEIVKALHTHAKKEPKIKKAVIVASSPTQYSSLEFALDNGSVIAP
jgi:hypothetical protein